MTTHDESNDPQRPSPSSQVAEPTGSKRRLLVLLGLLALALFALWYDYKVARPAVESAYQQIETTNDAINSAAEHRRMTNADVQTALKRIPSETFPRGIYTVEAYRWRAGMPIEIRGLSADETPGVGLKTFDYYAVYRKDGPDLAFVTHFKFKLDADYFAPPATVDAVDDGAPFDAAMSMPGMEGMGGGPAMSAGPESGEAGLGGTGGPGRGGPGPGGSGNGGPGGGGPGGGRNFDPEAFFAERDVDGDGQLAGEEISERMRGRLEAIDTNGDGAVSKEEFLAGRNQAGAPGSQTAP